MPYSVILLFNSYVLILYDVILCFDMFCYLILYYVVIYIYEVKLPTIWTDGNAEVEESGKRKETGEKESEERRSRWEKRKEESRETRSFSNVLAPEGRKGWLKRWVRSHVARWEMKNCAPLWREENFEVKMLKAPHARALLVVEMSKYCPALHMSKSKCTKRFKSGALLEVERSEKVHDGVVQSICRSQHVQNSSGPENVWKLRCSKSARSCGAKPSTCGSQHVKNTTHSHHFRKLRCCKLHAIVARTTFASQKC